MTVLGHELDTFECPECLVECRDFGDPIEIPIVFAVDASGRTIDPAKPDTPPPWNPSNN